jgi:hypothetical protein
MRIGLKGDATMMSMTTIGESTSYEENTSVGSARGQDHHIAHNGKSDRLETGVHHTHFLPKIESLILMLRSAPLNWQPCQLMLTIWRTLAIADWRKWKREKLWIGLGKIRDETRVETDSSITSGNRRRAEVWLTDCKGRVEV